MTSDVGVEAAGYEALIRSFDLKTLPHYRSSFIARRARATIVVGDREEHFYTSSYTPAGGLGGQLEFALKYDGVNLEILKRVFECCDRAELTAWIKSKPSGIYTRRAWFLYEWLIGNCLELPDLTRGTYTEVLDDRYICSKPINSKRHRVRDNLLGTSNFCPMLRHTPTLTKFRNRNLAERAKEILGAYPANSLHRAAQFLYLRETKSSFEIEQEQPTQQRTVRFVELLRASERVTDLDKATLVDLQNAIVDPRYAEADYRSIQNYVGQTLPGLREVVHYVSPQPQDVPAMMQGLLDCYRRLAQSDVDPVIWAATIAFGFVFIHPFEDGNGRIHRYLIHHILARSGFSPSGIVLPVSATMLSHAADYAQALEKFSEPLNKRLDFMLNIDGALTVKGESADHYRYFEATTMAEYMYQTLEFTVDNDLPQELDYLQKYDRARRNLQEIVDMPDRKLDLFIRLCLDNGGKLSARKRKSQFKELSDAEVDLLQCELTEALS